MFLKFATLLRQHDFFSPYASSPSSSSFKSVKECGKIRGESSSMSSNRHGAADTADTAAAAFVAVGGGPIVMTGISLSGLPGWTDGAPAARGFRGMNSNICLSGNHAALLTRLCLRLSFPVVANSDVLKGFDCEKVSARAICR